MDQAQVFITEAQALPSGEQSFVLRALYAPLIGPRAILAYELICDLHFNNGKLRHYESIKLLISFLKVSLLELEQLLVRLEAVGLLRRFERSDEKALILSLQLPLSFKQFRANSLLYRAVIDQIGELCFERAYFSMRQSALAKDDFTEVTTKYLDLFPNALASKPAPINSTLEVPLLTPKSKAEALLGLSNPQLVLYLTNQRVSPSQLSALNRALQLGFATPTLNLIIDYVVTRNSKFVTAHFETIVRDFHTKDCRGYDEVKVELDLAATKKVVVSDELVNLNNAPLVTSSNETWETLFNTLGGEL